MFVRYVYCHPLFDERKCSHRFSYQLKRAFAGAGFFLERFDYQGTGEAEGEFAEVTLESLREDIGRRAQGGQVCLIGLRLGASLVFDHCVRVPGSAAKAVLIAPIINGRAYVDYLRRKQRIKDLMTRLSEHELDDEGFENLEGYKTGVKFVERLQSLDLFDLARGYRLDNFLYIAQVSGREKADDDLVRLAEMLDGVVRRVCVERVNTPMFWERIPTADYRELTTKVLRWCCE
jgi:pimeloyl-ACP methyl ester carboxylesterase